MKKKNNAILLIAILFTISLGFFNVAYAEEPFEIKTSIGFNGFYKNNYAAPISIEVKNNEKDIDGKIQILFGNVFFADKELYTAYTKELNIAKGATKTIDMELKLANYITEYKIRILDKKNKIIWEDESVPMPSPKAKDVIGVGILSDEYESLWYLPLMTFSKLDEGIDKRDTAICDLGGKLSTDIRYLEMLDVIVINNFGTEKLTSEEKDVLKKWINNGGILLVGTGPNYNKTLSGLADINFINVNGTTTISEINNIKDSSGNSFNPEAPLPIIKAESDIGSVIVEEENHPIVFTKESGKGKITIFAFDLGLSPFIDWSKKDEFVENIIAGDIINLNVNSEQTLVGNGSNNRLFSLVQYLPRDRVPSGKIIITILIMFTIIVGPINYLILRKMDKREKAWITIPVISVIFSIVMLIWGGRVNFNEPLMNNISIIQINNDTNSYDISTFSGITNFRNGDIDISSNEDVDIGAKESYDYYVYSDYANYEDNDIILEYILSKNKIVSFKKKGVWDLQEVSLKETKKLEQGIIPDLKLKGNTISGEIKNYSNMNLEDAILIYGLEFYKLGDLKKGESKIISFDMNNPNSSNQSGSKYSKEIFQLIDSIYPWSSIQNTAKNQDTILNQAMKRDILEGFFLNYNGDSNNKDIYIIGWNTEKLSSDIMVNGKAPERIDRNIISIPVDLKYEKGEVVEIPHGIFTPQVLEISGLNYDTYNGTFYGQGDVVISIKSDEKIDFQEIDIELANARISSSHKAWVYNYNNNEWEELTLVNLIINNENKEIYYDEIQGTKLKLESDGMDQMWMPTFSVKGVAK